MFNYLKSSLKVSVTVIVTLFLRSSESQKVVLRAQPHKCWYFSISTLNYIFRNSLRCLNSYLQMLSSILVNHESQTINRHEKRLHNHRHLSRQSDWFRKQNRFVMDFVPPFISGGRQKVSYSVVGHWQVIARLQMASNETIDRCLAWTPLFKNYWCCKLLFSEDSWLEFNHSYSMFVFIYILVVYVFLFDFLLFLL